MKNVLGMGNALVDIMVPIEDDLLLETLHLPKGSMQLVDKDRSDEILSSVSGMKQTISAGGSAANTIHGLARLGVPAGYIGMVGEDEMGGYFVRDLIHAGADPHLIHSPHDTGKAIALVSNDSERTFATYLGAAVEMAPEHIRPVLFEGYSIFHIEGYLVQNHELIRKAVEEAKKAGLIVSLDLASYNVVESNKDFLTTIIQPFVDILFANEEEAKAFTGLEPEKALKTMSKMVDISIIKTGRSGSLVKRGKEIARIGIIPVTPVDTTGAGDLYASGFLFGIANGQSLQRCGELGAMLAGNVIEFM